jgi:hypothetical protein
MITVNCSYGKDNYSQRNNEIDPFGSCNVTAMVSALDYLGVRFPGGKRNQPEDRLYEYIKENKGEPTNHGDLSKFTNQWVGKTITKFSTAVPLETIITEVCNNRPVIMSGDFPGYPTKKPKPLGHIVCLVGAQWNGMNSIIGHPDFFIVDDPYGNTLDDWKGSGNDIKIPYNLFIEWLKPLKDDKVKWGHTFIV